MRLLVCLAAAAGLAYSAGPIERGLRFIYQTSRAPANFAKYGEDYLLCFYNVATTSKDPALARLALGMGREIAAHWTRDNAVLPANPRPDTIVSYAFGGYFARKLGSPAPQLEGQIRRAAARYTAQDYLKFDPRREPPPGDVPEDCPKCARVNPRGATKCFRCGAPLRFRSGYSVWLDALLISYTGKLCGVTFGASYPEVVQLAPAMRPYPLRSDLTGDEFDDVVYCVTHLIYTQNDYNHRRLSPRNFPAEFDFLKASVKEAIAIPDLEMLGELVDTLKGLGLTNRNPLVRSGMEYLLAHQNEDGSWGDPKETDVYIRYHHTWTAIDGLRDYRF